MTSIEQARDIAFEKNLHSACFMKYGANGPHLKRRVELGCLIREDTLIDSKAMHTSFATVQFLFNGV